MPFTTWIRDLLGIRKDVIDTKKAKLEITKLEDEECERQGLIELATLDDVKKYDPKTRYLITILSVVLALVASFAVYQRFIPLVMEQLEKLQELFGR